MCKASPRGNRTDTLALLADLNAGVKSSISYQSRETEGTQTPVETLNRGWGSCRDLTVLLIEAARCFAWSPSHRRGLVSCGHQESAHSLDWIDDIALRKLRDPLERFMRRLIGAIERSARFCQSTHQCRP